MPGKRPWGTTRRLRLFFNTTTAPNEVFTDGNNANPPIREVTLPCGTAAQVIHKWQRLNQFRPPHLVNRWATNAPNITHRSYAAAASTATNPPRHPTATPNENQATHLARAQDVNNSNPSYTPNPSPLVNASTTPRTQPTQPTPTTSRTPAPSTNLPTHQPSSQHEPRRPLEEVEWDSNEPLITQMETDTASASNNVTLSSTPKPHPTTEPSLPHHSPPNLTPTSRSNNPTNLTTPPAPITHMNTRQSSRAPKPNPAHPAPAHDSADPTEWQQVKRPRTRKPAQPSHTTIQTPTPTIQRSLSKGRKPKSTNKFAPLDLEIMPTFEDESVAPIEVVLRVRSPKPARRKYKDTRRAVTKPITDANAQKQQIRHPAHLLQHMSPRQSQVVLRSTNPATKEIRERLLNQIALLRAARANTTSQRVLLDNYDDKVFFGQVGHRVSECDEPPTCTDQTAIDIPIRAIFEGDELRFRSAMCFTRIDLATRAILPHLYDVWPDEPKWNNVSLKWLPATDQEVPCLQDESLAALAACPTLQNVWAHIATTSPDLSAALNTAANQWHLHINGPANQNDSATLSSTQ